MRARSLLVALALVTAGVGLVALPASPAGATHPCPQSTNGSPSYDSGVSSDHDACTPPPTPQPGDVVLREGDAGSTATVQVGGRLFVQLASGWTGPLWTDITGTSALHRILLDEQRPSTTAVFVPGRTSNSEQVVATGGPSPWSATVVVVAPVDPQPTPSPTSCTPIPWNGSGTLSDADNGRTVTVARGDVVVVAFAGCSGVDYQPATADAPLLRYRAHGEHPGAARSIFSAAATGTATITAESDAACFHSSPACAIAQRSWQVTVHVIEPCAMSGSPQVPAGSMVQLQGRVAAGAAVQIWMRRRGETAFVVRRQLTAGSDGSFATQYTAYDDYRWYATTADCTTTAALTRAMPWVDGPTTATRGSRVALVLHGPAGATGQLWMHGPGAAYAVRRTGTFDAVGSWRTSYVASTDERYYLVSGPDRRTSEPLLTSVH